MKTILTKLLSFFHAVVLRVMRRAPQKRYIVEMSNLSQLKQEQLPQGYYWRQNSPARVGDTIEYFCCNEHPQRQIVIIDLKRLPRSKPHRIVVHGV